MSFWPCPPLLLLKRTCLFETAQADFEVEILLPQALGSCCYRSAPPCPLSLTSCVVCLRQSHYVVLAAPPGSVSQVLALKVCATNPGPLPIFNNLFILCVWLFCMLLCLCTMFLPCPWRSEVGVRASGSRVADSCEPLCGCWEPNLGPLKEQQVFSTAKPSLLEFFFNYLLFIYAVSCL